MVTSLSSTIERDEQRPRPLHCSPTYIVHTYMYVVQYSTVAEFPQFRNGVYEPLPDPRAIPFIVRLSANFDGKVHKPQINFKRLGVQISAKMQLVSYQFEYL